MCAYIYIYIYIYIIISLSLYIYIYLYLSLYIYICLSIYIYIYRERDLSLYLSISLSLYIYIFMFIYLVHEPAASGATQSSVLARPPKGRGGTLPWSGADSIRRHNAYHTKQVLPGWCRYPLLPTIPVCTRRTIDLPCIDQSDAGMHSLWFDE